MSTRWRTRISVAAVLAVIAVIAGLSAYLSAPRSGGPMDPESTSPTGAHALVALLRDRGVKVIVADEFADVERESRTDTLLLVDDFGWLSDNQLHRLARVPGDLLLVEPTSSARRVLAPNAVAHAAAMNTVEPDCALPAANHAGPVDFGFTETYRPAIGVPATSCYDGALVQYRENERTVTVVGGSQFMMNRGLLPEGNAALAMNLAGARPRLLWYAPQHSQGEASHSATLSDLIPAGVRWLCWQLALVVALLALWKGRRIGPLVAEQLPVVVRASETVEGRGRLYRSRRARDRAAEALRTATLQRLRPRLGLALNAEPPAVVMAIAARGGTDPNVLHQQLYGPTPESDSAMVQLAQQLDDIERQVRRS